MRVILGMVSLAAMWISIQSSAATLSVGQVDATPGETTVAVPLSLVLSPGNVIAALQGDIAFDSQMLSLSDVSIGPAAAIANKSVSFSIQAPGLVRLIIAGLNQTAIADGVVANMIFSVANSTPSGMQAITLSNALAADPTGAPVPISPVSGGIAVYNEDGEGDSTMSCFGATLLRKNRSHPQMGDIMLTTMIALALVWAARRTAPTRC